MKSFAIVGEITQKNMAAAIAFLEANQEETEVCFYIDSPGGDVFSGLSLLRAMDNYHGKLIAEVGTMAASMGAFIALNCDLIRVTKNSFVMIHSAWCQTEGKAEDLRATADLLEQASNRLGEIVGYKAKDTDAVAGYMAKDTWFGADLFASLFDSVEVIDENRFNKAIAATYSMLKTCPTELAALLESNKKEPENLNETGQNQSTNPENDKKETENEPEPKIDNSFAESVLAKVQKYL